MGAEVMDTDNTQISVSASTDRLTRREQIEQVLERARSKKEPIRVRIPFQLYDYDTTRGYLNVRDASWNLTLPILQATPDTVEDLIAVIDKFVRALGELGARGTAERLEGDR